MDEGRVIIGEVHTGLLQHSSAVAPDLTAVLLDFVRGERVRTSRRPIDHARSPEVLTGVDCWLPTSNRAKVRGVGTAVSRAAITGGQVAQGTAYTTVVRGAAQRRLAWSHYLGHRGAVETIGKVDVATVADGFLTSTPATDYLNLAAIGERALDRVQHQPALDHRPAFKSLRGQLRFVISGQSSDLVSFAVDSSRTRRLRLPHRDLAITDVVDLCEDVALHDWLLTTMVVEVERNLGEGLPRQQAVARLAPLLEHLGHLWMPAARTDLRLADVWAALEERPGLSRQWQATLGRVRDQLALATFEQAQMKV